MKRKRIKKHGAYDYGFKALIAKMYADDRIWLSGGEVWVNFYPLRPSGKPWYMKETSK